MKIGYLNINKPPSHIHHITPIAFEHSIICEDEIILYILPEHQEIVRHVAQHYPKHNCKIICLKKGFLKNIYYKIKRQQNTIRYLLKRHLEELLSLDAIAAPDHYLLTLIDYAKSNNKKFISVYTSHGPFSEPHDTDLILNKYDMLLIKCTAQLKSSIKYGLCKSNHCPIIGYPKLDLMPSKKNNLFNNNKPIVLYNPHWVPERSSLNTYGKQILDFFANQTQYNLIFSPHPFTSKRHLNKIIKGKHRKCKNILIDLGGEKSIDMTYNKAADIYLGDFSSQVCEFLYIPRPCIFIHPQIKHKQIKSSETNINRYWHLGENTDKVDDLPQIIKSLLKENPYQKKQELFFKNRFDLTNIPSAKRAAKAINSFLKNKLQSK